MVDHLEEPELRRRLSDPIHKVRLRTREVDHGYEISLTGRVEFIGPSHQGLWWVEEDAGNPSYARVNQAFHSEFGVVKFLQLFAAFIINQWFIAVAHCNFSTFFFFFFFF
uniref:Uncharacterized protein n=1 Tax=Opuntia streptacantha TaxID=393608 RepID=A0A7C8ZXH5_OPUST